MKGCYIMKLYDERHQQMLTLNDDQIIKLAKGLLQLDFANEQDEELAIAESADLKQFDRGEADANYAICILNDHQIY